MPHSTAASVFGSPQTIERIIVNIDNVGKWLWLPRCLMVIGATAAEKVVEPDGIMLEPEVVFCGA
jgi:hypothetical protein